MAPVFAVDIEVNTQKIVSNETGTKRDRRKIQVTVSELSDQKASILVVWIGDKGNTSKYGIFRKAKREITNDGTYDFSVTYNRKGKFSRNYRGYAVRLVGENNSSLAEHASLTPFLRFLPGE